MRDRMIRLAMRLLRVPCAEHGGGDDYVGQGRWCLKPFGHSDSCAFDVVRQPLWHLRRRCRGWEDDREGPPVQGDTH